MQLICYVNIYFCDMKHFSLIKIKILFAAIDICIIAYHDDINNSLNLYSQFGKYM